MAKPIKKKFFEVEIPLIDEKIEIFEYALEDAKDKTIKIDMTRKTRGKNIDLIFSIDIKDNKALAKPKKLILLPYFIKNIFRSGISYVEDSMGAETKESKIIIKPFLITRKKVSRVVRKTLRNSARNWLIDYSKTRTNSELFEDVLSGQLQKALSLKLKKIYPLALCEIRILEVKNPLATK